jgi:diguanylate cyclase (GGDEF)-like protein/PAS domain S-box-containing protein
MDEYAAHRRSRDPTEFLKTKMRFPRHAWWLYLALMLPVSVAYLAGPLNAGPAYNAIGFSGAVAMVVGVRMHRPAARSAWYVLAIAQVLFVGGDVLAYNYTAIVGGALPTTSLADVFYLSCYPVTAAGLLLLIRSRTPGRDWASLIDSAIVTIGLALLSWIVLIAPLAHNAALPLGTKLVSIAYPLADILVLGVAVRLAVGTGRRSSAFYMIVGALIVVLAADSAYGWSLLHGVHNLATPLDAGWIAAHLLFGAAALHPSMTTVSQAAGAKLRLTPVRFVAIAAAALIAPVIMVVKASARGGSDEIVVGCAAIVLFALVVVRMIGLARDQQAATARERTMRRAADAFVTATSPAEIVRAAQDAAGVLAGVAAQPTVLRVEERDGARLLVGADPSSGDGELQLPLTLLPEGVVDQLERRVAVDLCMVDLRGAEAVMLGPGLATPVFAVPILAQGRLAGAVALLDATDASNPTRSSLETLAGQVGLALESAALTESMVRTQSEARLSALVQHSTDVILVITADTTVEYASPSIRQILGYEDVQFVGQRLSGYVADEDQALFQPALAVLLTLASETSEAFEFRIRHRDGRLLYTECLITNLLSNTAVGGIVVNLRDITERKQFEAQLTYQAFHDPVTDLANRALFRDRVEHALSRRRDHSRSLAVLFLDLDDFKSINDRFGHLAGDRMLQTISSRLRAALRVSDTVARLGGDEFAVLLEEIVDETAVSEIVEGLLEAIRAPLLLDDHEVSAQCSIGIAIARSNSAGEAAATVDEVLRNADVAMYQAKAAGGDTYRYFKLEMHDAVVEQLALRADLNAAIAAGELTLAYQPIFDLASDEISGSEALLRWEHAVRGTVSPATFIPVAEDSGLIIPLGRWVLERACHDAMAFQHADPNAEHHTVSVNISARQLHRVEIVEEVRDALRSSGLDPVCLVLEITESLLIDDIELAIERLSALRTLGVRIAVDDFGTGYSSLNYIRRLPIDFLKIDKDFIDSVDANDMEGKLTAAMIGLARVLDLGCVAEGVERTAQHRRLKELGCDYAQGFLLARPMTADAMRELLVATVPAHVAAV